MTQIDDYHYWHAVVLLSFTVFAGSVGQYILALVMAPIALFSVAVFDWRVNSDRYESVFDDVGVETRVGHTMIHFQTLIICLSWLAASLI